MFDTEGNISSIPEKVMVEIQSKKKGSNKTRSSGVEVHISFPSHNINLEDFFKPLILQLFAMFVFSWLCITGEIFCVCFWDQLNKCINKIRKIIETQGILVKIKLNNVYMIHV